MTAKPLLSSTGCTIYPSYCHSLSPTFGEWCPLTAADVHALELIPGFDGQEIYHYRNHPIKWVRLTGVIVAAEEFSGRMVYTLDDSSGVNIELTCLAPPKPEPVLSKNGTATTANPLAQDAEHTSTSPDEHFKSPDGPNLKNIDLGSVVKVKGGIGTFRNEKQLKMIRIVLLGDTNAEVKCWRDVMTFKKDVLSQPWFVSAEDEARCLEEADTEAKLKKEEEERRKKAEMKKKIREKDRELAQKNRRSNGDNKNRGNDRSLEKRLAQKRLLEEADREEREVREKKRLEREIGKISSKRSDAADTLGRADREIGKLSSKYPDAQERGANVHGEDREPTQKRRLDGEIGKIGRRKYTMIEREWVS